MSGCCKHDVKVPPAAAVEKTTKRKPKSEKTEKKKTKKPKGPQIKMILPGKRSVVIEGASEDVMAIVRKLTRKKNKAA